MIESKDSLTFEATASEQNIRKQQAAEANMASVAPKNDSEQDSNPVPPRKNSTDALR